MTVNICADSRFFRDRTKYESGFISVLLCGATQHLTATFSMCMTDDCSSMENTGVCLWIEVLIHTADQSQTYQFQPGPRSMSFEWRASHPICLTCSAPAQRKMQFRLMLTRTSTTKAVSQTWPGAGRSNQRPLTSGQEPIVFEGKLWAKVYRQHVHYTREEF